MRKSALGLAMALLAANPVNTQALWAAEPLKTGLGTRYYDGPPPVRFIKEGFVPVLFVAPGRINEACGLENPDGLTLVACARMTKGGVKVVIMPHPCAAMIESYALVLCHETAHAIGGWSGEHPA